LTTLSAGIARLNSATVSLKAQQHTVMYTTDLMDTSMSWTGPLQRNGENIEKSENRMGSVK
jgi:hypothetical protein